MEIIIPNPKSNLFLAQGRKSLVAKLLTIVSNLKVAHREREVSPSCIHIKEKFYLSNNALFKRYFIKLLINVLARDLGT